MSYKVAFAADALSDWQKLEVNAQDAVLDEIDRLALHSSFPASVVQVTAEVRHESAGIHRRISIYTSLRHDTNTISVLGMNEVEEV